MPTGWANAAHEGPNGHGMPMLCSCMIGVVRNDRTSKILEEWLRLSRHPEEVIKEGRVGDQEVLATILRDRWKAQRISIWALPNEFQCPLAKSDDETWVNGPSGKPALAKYKCRAIHSHFWQTSLMANSTSERS